MALLNVGYVGCGFMAQNVHLPNLRQSAQCALEGLAEVRTDLGRKVQAKFGIPRLHDSHRAMARDDRYDAFAVSAGYVAQGQIARDLLRTGRPVFMEKPIALTVQQALAVAEAAQTPGARLMVGYMMRYDAGYQLARAKVKEMRAAGRLGDLTYVRSHGFRGDWIAGADTAMETSAEPRPPENWEGPDWLPPACLHAYVGYVQQYVQPESRPLSAGCRRRRPRNGCGLGRQGRRRHCIPARQGRPRRAGNRQLAPSPLG